MSRGRVWIKHGLVGTVTAVVLLGAAGVAYQLIAAQSDVAKYPPPGQLVNLDGRRIHLLVKGGESGRPTVLLEAGMAGFSSNWAWVQEELSAVTRVVASDRAGLGWSDPAPKPQDAQESARDLHTALQAAGIRGPYVVAGHSYGGLVVRAFADLYPQEVAGMVLVDASHPDQWAHFPASRDGKLTGYGNRFFGVLARLGLVRLFHLGSSLYTGLPQRPAAEMQAVLAQPQSWKASGDILLLWNERTRPQVNQARSLGDLPLVVLSVTEQPSLVGDTLTALQAELPALSTNSLHWTVKGATHEGLVAEREHARVVTGAILQVMEAAETGQPLPVD